MEIRALNQRELEGLVAILTSSGIPGKPVRGVTHLDGSIGDILYNLDLIVEREEDSNRMLVQIIKGNPKPNLKYGWFDEGLIFGSKEVADRFYEFVHAEILPATDKEREDIYRNFYRKITELYGDFLLDFKKAKRGYSINTIVNVCGMLAIFSMPYIIGFNSVNNLPYMFIVGAAAVAAGAITQYLSHRRFAREINELVADTKSMLKECAETAKYFQQAKNYTLILKPVL